MNEASPTQPQTTRQPYHMNDVGPRAGVPSGLRDVPKSVEPGILDFVATGVQRQHDCAGDIFIALDQLHARIIGAGEQAASNDRPASYVGPYINSIQAGIEAQNELLGAIQAKIKTIATIL